MNEGIPSNREDGEGPIRKGSLVKFREDLDAELKESLGKHYDLNAQHRVYHIEHHNDEGGDAVWIGPANASVTEIEDFNPELYMKDTEIGRVKGKNIFPVIIRHIKAELN